MVRPVPRGARQKYALTPHVLSDEALSDRRVWVHMDCTVLTWWIYDTVSNDLLQSLMLHQFNARGAWRFLEDEFLNHSESRALLRKALYNMAADEGTCRTSVHHQGVCSTLGMHIYTTSFFIDPTSLA